MKIIAHRGNLDGPGRWENHPFQIARAVYYGFDVEIDVWLIDGQNWFSGHNDPQYVLGYSWLLSNTDRFWLHAKNLPALEKLLSDDLIKHVFWHQNDDFTITKSGFIWTYPGRPLTAKSIAVLKGKGPAPPECFGVCTDYPQDVDCFV